jgi:hypothetical protein
VKRITLIFATLVTMAVMMVAAAAPAFASHGWEWTEFVQWRDTHWYCSYLWNHDEDENWNYEGMWCYNDRTGDTWTDL